MLIMLWSAVCTVLKSIFITYGLYETFIFFKYIIYQKILVRYMKSPIHFQEYGQWAVVTGCTDGIGKAVSHAFGKKGMDVVLISRSKEKLDAIATKLSEKYGIKTKTIVADFINCDEVIPKVQKELNDLDIGVLVNNVGVSTGVTSFLRIDKNEVMDLIEINIKSTIKMCSIVLPSMVKKRKGVIINMSALSAEINSPYLTCYSASKAFISKFSTDLNKEYKNYGIIVHCLKGGLIGTKLTNLPIIPWLIPSPRDYAENALKTVGWADVTTGYSFHDIFEFVLKLMQHISDSTYNVLHTALLPYFANLCGTKSTAIRQTKIVK